MLIVCILNGVSQAQESIVPFPPEPAITNFSDVEQRLQELTEVNARFAQQLEELQFQNTQLTEQLRSQTPVTRVMISETDASDIPPAELLPPGLLNELQPSDVLTDQPLSSTLRQAEVTHPFDELLLWSTADEEWTFELHNETQIDVRTYSQDHSDPVNQTGIYLPRMRLIFNGHLTKPIEYNVSINKGLGSLDLLDSYFNFNYDDRAQFRIGRYRVPFTYDWYALSNQFLTTLERSVFAINYGYNRNTAAMVHGEILDESAEYAIAVANGPRNSYYDENSAKDIMAYVNMRPFQSGDDDDLLNNLNVGGSVCYGVQDQNPLPIAFHTSASATTSGGTTVGVPSFLTLNGDVVERGERSMWEAHLAYYYKQLTLMAAIDGGFNTYGFRNAPGAVEVPVSAWHVQFGYYLTGETITRRTMLNVKRPFDLRRGKRGPGAWELQARFDHFRLGSNVFSGGLADPAHWTNRVNTLDCGVNWSLNRYVRIAFDWQRAMYADPVQYAPGRSSDHTDLFWVRFQNYF